MSIGIDIVEIDRFQKFKNKIDKLNSFFTENELKFLKSQQYNINILAQLFSIKEAVSKALGTGFSNGVAPTNIDLKIINDKIEIILLGQAKKIFDIKGYKSIIITFSSNKKIISICKFV